MRIFKKKYDIQNLILKNINYNSTEIIYKNPLKQYENKNISRSVNNIYIINKNKGSLNCDEKNDLENIDEIIKEDFKNKNENDYRILPDVDPPNCIAPNCELLLDIFGNPFINNDPSKYEQKIDYYDYTIKTYGDEEDVDTLINDTLAELSDIQKKIENRYENINFNLTNFKESTKFNECYKKIKNTEEKFEEKIVKYSNVIKEISKIEILKDKNIII